MDNLAKFVLDSMNSVFYADDRQVVSLCIEKRYDPDYYGKTTVKIKAV